MNDGRLAGRVVLVTGATSGLGRATALAFARGGARRLVSGRDASRGRDVVEEIRSLGAEGDVAADAGDPESAGTLVRRVLVGMSSLPNGRRFSGGCRVFHR